MAPPIPPAPAAASESGWGWRQRSAQFYCLLILFGFPIFSVPCRKGFCTSPLDVVATYAYAKDLIPDEWTITLLYPATLMLKMEVLMGDEPQSFRPPQWDSVLPTWHLTASLKDEEKTGGRFPFSLIPDFFSMIDPYNPRGLSWEFVGACAVCMTGGLLSILGPNKISFWGIMLVLWFIYWEGGKRADVSTQPMFGLAIICSLGWVNFKDIFSMPREEDPAAPSTPTPLSGTTADDGEVEEFKKKQ